MRRFLGRRPEFLAACRIIDKIRVRESFSPLPERLSLSSARTLSPKTTPVRLSSPWVPPKAYSTRGLPFRLDQLEQTTR